MGGIKVTLVIGLSIALAAGAVIAFIQILPYLLVLIGLFVIAELLVRIFGIRRKADPQLRAVLDETHSPRQTRPD